MNLDETDVKILWSLVSDARLSSRQISKKAGVSIGTVLSRMGKLEKAGIIRGYSAVMDHERLGYMLTALIEITVSKGPCWPSQGHRLGSGFLEWMLLSFEQLWLTLSLK